MNERDARLDANARGLVMITQRQSKKRSPWNLANIWRRLVEPAPAIREPAHRRRARLLSLLLVILIPLGILAIILTLLDTRSVIEPTKDAVIYTTLIAVIVLGLAYRLSRTTRYILAAMITVIVVLASIFVTANLGAENVYLHYLVIGVVMGSLFFSWRGTALVLVATFVGILLFSVLVPKLAWWDIVDALFLVIGTGVLMMVSAVVHQGDLVQIEQQSHTLNASEKRFRALIENSSDAVMLLDSNGTILYATPAATRISGYTIDEFVGWKAFELIHPDERGYIENVFAQLVQEPRAIKTEQFRSRHKDGSWRWFEVIVTNLLAEPSVEAIVVNYRDITERKQAEEALEHLQRQNKLILDSAGEGILGLGLEGKHIFVNPAAARMLGYGVEELIGKPSHLTWHHTKADGTLYLEEECLIYETLMDGTIHRIDDEVFWRKDGISFPVGYTSTPIREGNKIMGAVVTFRDFTERKQAEEALHQAHDELELRVQYRTTELAQANQELHTEIAERKRTEEALRESEKRFRSLFEDSPISLWEEDFSLVTTYIDKLRQSGITDFWDYFENHPEAVAQCAAMAKVVDVNKGTLKLYKAKSKEDLLAGLNLVLGEEGLPIFRKELIAIAKGKTGFEDEVVNQTLTGEKIHLALSWSVAPGYERTYSQVFVSINDITARKWAEGKLAAKVGELEQHNRETTLLNEMGDLLQTCHTVEEAGTVVTQFAQRLFPNQAGALCLIAASRNLVDAIATWGEFPLQDRVFTPEDCWALRRGQTHCVTDPSLGLLCRHVSQPFSTEQQSGGGYLCVPMMAQGETLGILHLRSGQPAASQTEQKQEAVMASQQQLVVTLAEHIALALANLKLQEALHSQAIRDPLTGLFNRRYMEETLERELRRAERQKVSLGIVMFDLDHFKNFNDTFGHPAGDVVLREIGAFLKTCVRAEDIACRYGGEEFLVILPEASLKDTLKRAEQLRKGIKRLHVRYHDQALGAVTVSLGAAVFPDHGSTTEAMVRGADAALYRAKQEGRDRVVVA